MPVKPKTREELIAEQQKINRLPAGVGMNEAGQETIVPENRFGGMPTTFRRMFGTPEPTPFNSMQADDEFRKQLEIEAIQKEKVPEIPQIVGKATEKDLLPQISGNLPQRIAGAAKTLGEAAPPNFIRNELMGIQTQGGELVKRSVAEIYDVLHTAITRKEPLKRQKAKEAFTSSSEILKSNIQAVEEGTLDYETALRDYNEAASNLETLEQETKGLATLNLDWWIDNGKGVQADILREQRLLEGLRLQLNQAFLTNQQNRMNAIFNPAQAIGAAKT